MKLVQTGGNPSPVLVPVARGLVPRRTSNGRGTSPRATDSIGPPESAADVRPDVLDSTLSLWEGWV